MASVAANTYTNTLNDLFTTARTDFAKDYVESWSTSPSLLRDIYKRAVRKTENPTGPAYEWPLELGTPSGVNRRAFDTAPPLTGQNPNIRIVARANISTYEYLLETTHDMMNLIKGSKVLVDDVRAKIKNFGKKLRDDLNRDAMATATATNGITSAVAVLPSDPTTGTVFNVNRATYADWRPVTTTTGGIFAAVGHGQIRSTFLASSRGNGDDEPDLLATDDTIFNSWWALNDTRDNFWLDEDDEGKTVRRAMKFLTAKWCWDHQYPNSTTMRMLNTKHMQLNVIGEEDPEMMGVHFDPWVLAYNASKSAAIVRWQGQLIWKAFKFCAQISGWTA